MKRLLVIPLLFLTLFCNAQFSKGGTLLRTGSSFITPQIEGEEEATPATFTLTATGTGAGVATIRVQVSEDQTLTLSDAGRFYSNSGGTSDEATSWVVTSGALRTYYLKVTTGTSTLTFPDADKVIAWGNSSGSGYTAGTNMPQVTGSVAQFTTTLTNIRVTCTISGSIAGLTGLTYVSLGTGNTVEGSINSLTAITYFSVLGSNTLSGTIETFNTTNLTLLNVTGSNTLSGAITSFTNLTSLRLEGSNTCSGSLTNLTSLTYLILGGSNTVAGDLGANNMVDGITDNLVISAGRIVTYTSGATWENCTITINPSTGYGLDGGEIDAMVVDMANSGTLSGKTITLRGSNATPTGGAGYLAAKSTLETAGCTLLVN